MPYTKKAEAIAYNIFLIVLAWGISAAAQLADGYIIRDTLRQQSAAVQWLIEYGVPLVPALIMAAVAGRGIVAQISEVNSQVAPPKAARNQPTGQADPATVQYALDTAGPMIRRNELTAEDWEFIAGHSSRQIMAKYGISGRTARDWRNAVKTGKA